MIKKRIYGLSLKILIFNIYYEKLKNYMVSLKIRFYKNYIYLKKKWIFSDYKNINRLIFKKYL